MKSISTLLLVITLSTAAWAQDPQELPGDRHRITVTHESESKGEGSSSSSRGGHEYIEQIVAVRSDGTERAYDLPLDPADEERLINGISQ